MEKICTRQQHTRSVIQTGRDQVDYNQQRASAHYSLAIDERLKAESDHGHEVLAWEMRVNGLESKLFTGSDTEAHTIKLNTELAVRLAGKNTRHSVWLKRDLVILLS